MGNRFFWAAYLSKKLTPKKSMIMPTLTTTLPVVKKFFIAVSMVAKGPGVYSPVVTDAVSPGGISFSVVVENCVCGSGPVVAAAGAGVSAGSSSSVMVSGSFQPLVVGGVSVTSVSGVANSCPAVSSAVLGCRAPSCWRNFSTSVSSIPTRLRLLMWAPVRIPMTRPKHAPSQPSINPPRNNPMIPKSVFIRLCPYLYIRC